MHPQSTPTITIYALTDDRSGEVRYIGQTIQPLADRLYQHVSAARQSRQRSRVRAWIAALNVDGRRPIIAALAAASEAEATATETRTIARYLAQGADLLNTPHRGSNYAWLRYAERTRVSVAQRFWAKVRQTSTCWLWIGSRNPKGYGMLRIDGRAVKAHRVAYELLVGPIPVGVCCCHTCDNPSCVRPDHLWLGSIADNSADMARKKRGWGRPTGPVVTMERRARGQQHGSQTHPECVPRGELNGGGGHKLTEADVQQIRALHTGRRGDGVRLAQQFGVSRSMISLVIRGRKWIRSRPLAPAAAPTTQ